MNSILEQTRKKIRSNFLKLDPNKYLLDKNQIKKSQKLIWFKGSRYR